MGQTLELFGIDDVRFLGAEDRSDGGKVYRLYRFEYEGSLPVSCPRCGGKMYRHGTRRISLIAMPIQDIPAAYSIEFSRLRCRVCGAMESPHIKGVAEGRRCTEKALISIARKCLSHSFEAVAADYPATSNTIRNIFLEYFHEHESEHHRTAPAFIGITQKTLGRNDSIYMVFDLEHGVLFDMLSADVMDSVQEFFLSVDSPERILQIRSTVMLPLDNGIIALMPDAEIIPDGSWEESYINQIRAIQQESSKKGYSFEVFRIRTLYKM